MPLSSTIRKLYDRLCRKGRKCSIFFVIIRTVIIAMNIIYRKNTLYVYVRENIDAPLVSKMEDRINNIMGTYNIDNLVIRTNGQNIEGLKGFEHRYNMAHSHNLIIK